ncbi:hypothetical protein OMCYN_01758 [cyanobiont of Ornithocercus magnificus]|nr:hypothetical protein OMCYN_01758 [cyanobiont of Ornithocercus magnificus]
MFTAPAHELGVELPHTRTNLEGAILLLPTIITNRLAWAKPFTNRIKRSEKRSRGAFVDPRVCDYQGFYNAVRLNNV